MCGRVYLYSVTVTYNGLVNYSILECQTLTNAMCVAQLSGIPSMPQTEPSVWLQDLEVLMLVINNEDSSIDILVHVTWLYIMTNIFTSVRN